MLLAANLSYSQKVERVFLPGTRISIIPPPKVLIPKHTSTLFIDSTIEFATIEFPNKEELEEHMLNDVLNKQKTNSKKKEIKIENFTGTIIVSNFKNTHTLFQSYFGDSTFMILSQCIYKNESKDYEERLTSIVKSMKIDKNKKINIKDYFSFTYDSSNVFKLNPIVHFTYHLFTPNGTRVDSMYKSTNITCTQFPTHPKVKSSSDLIMVLIASYSPDINIQKILYEDEIIINEQNAYKFNAICERKEQTYELIILALFDPKSCVYLSCHIINDEFREDAYSFLSSIKHKKDGY